MLDDPSLLNQTSKVRFDVDRVTGRTPIRVNLASDRTSAAAENYLYGSPRRP